MNHMPRSFLAGVLLALLLTTTSFAQSTSGSITGMVTDPSGAIVPAAEVEVTNVGMGVTTRVTSNSVGVFNLPNLDAGTYRVRVSARGFTTYERAGLVLGANQIINVEARLTVGATAQVVEVKAASPIISTQASDIADTMTSQAALALPLVARQAGDYGMYAYAALATGVGASEPGTPYTPVFGGVRDSTGTMGEIDGISVMAYPQGSTPVSTSMEAAEEIKVESSVAPAEFSMAANIQMVTKSGANHLHGRVFEDYNGNALNARDFFGATTAWRVYNNFGGSAGGPIKKNKLFFFVDYEGSREAARTTHIESVPLPAWRNGDFSAQSKAVIDPLTGAQFPGNIIPPARISQVSSAIQAYIYPLPNNGAAGVVANNWTVNALAQTGFTRYNRNDSRVDWNMGKRDSAFVRLSWNRMPYIRAGVNPIFRIETRYGQDGVLTYNHTISATAFNEFRFGSTYHRNYFVCDVIGSNLLQQWGIQGVSTAGVPTAPYFGITGLTAWDPSSGSCYYNDNPDTSLEWLDNLTWTRGRHVMKFGGLAIRDRYNGNSISYNVYGQYTFSGIYTGTGYADFLLGIPQTTALAIPNPNRYIRGNTYGMYAQDQFRVTKTLTLNYGVRWELPMPYSDLHDRIYSYDPATGGLVMPNYGVTAINPYYPKNIPVVAASNVGYPATTLVNPDLRNVEPRVGFAYRLFGSDKTVLRGGYGIYTNLIYQQVAAGLTGGPTSGSLTFQNTMTNGVPAFSFPSPFLPTGTAATQSVHGTNPNLRTPYTQQWNLTLERQVGTFGFRASYTGSTSIHLLYNRNLNEPAPSTTPFSTKLYPNQLFSTITYSDNGGVETYNALELMAQKKLGNNFTFQSGYTWDKDLTDAQDNGAGGSSYTGQTIQNQFCRACERSNGEIMSPRRFYTYAVYALPVGTGQHLLPNAHGVVQAFLGGWRTSWTLELNPGIFFTPSFSSFDPSNTGVNGGVPDRLSGVPLYPAHRTVTDWFNPAAFQIPGCPASDPICSNSKDFVAPGRFGTSGWNYLNSPPIRNLDFDLSKEFKVSERYAVRFHMMMVDALNHYNFAAPAANISATTTVGVISGGAVPLLGEPDSRQIDFGLRLIF